MTPLKIVILLIAILVVSISPMYNFTYEYSQRTDYFISNYYADILLEITDENIKVEIALFKWIAGIPVLLIAGVIVISRKRKQIRK